MARHRQNPDTVHQQASAPVPQERRNELAFLLAERVTPQPGTAGAYLWDQAAAIADGSPTATRFTADKCRQWLLGQPTRLQQQERAALIEPWGNWESAKLFAISDAVLVHGTSPGTVAADHGTTRETVDDIVAHRRTYLRQRYTTPREDTPS